MLTAPFSTGHRLHQPRQRGVRVHAGARAGERGGAQRARAAGRGAHVPVPVLLVHGQRDQLPSEAVPGGGRQGPLLGPLSLHHQHPQRIHAQDQRRAVLLHRGLHRAEGLRSAAAAPDDAHPAGGGPAAGAAPRTSAAPADGGLREGRGTCFVKRTLIRRW